MKKILKQTTRAIIPAIQSIALVFVMALTLWSCSKDDIEPIETGEVAPSFTLKSLTGDDVSLSNFNNKVVVLFFFGNSCPSCKAAAPKVESMLVAPFANSSDYMVLGLDQWDGNAASVNAFKSSTGVTFPLLLKASGVATNYNTTYDRLVVIDKSGKIAFSSKQSAAMDISAVKTKVMELISPQVAIDTTKPEMSLNPTSPEIPTDSVIPATPEIPISPEAPVVSETPVTPITPVVPEAPSTPSNKAPSFTLKSLDDDDVSLSSFNNKVVVLFFFGNSCPSCKAAAPNVESMLVTPFASKQDYMVLGLDQWNGNATSVKAFKSATGVTFPLLLNASGVASDYKTTYDRIVVIDKAGNIAFKGTQSAASDIASAKAKVLELLAK